MSKDRISEFHKLNDIIDEISLCTTILHYAKSGHATPLMIEQAIVLVDKQIAYCKETNDATWLENAVDLKAGLEQALIDGVKSLKVKQGPGPEIREVQDPLARMRSEAGHRVRVQHRCAGGIIDIFDITADELIECKHIGAAAALGEAAGQLARYGKSFPGSALTIAVLRIEDDGHWLADLLRGQGFTIIELERGDG